MPNRGLGWLNDDPGSNSVYLITWLLNTRRHLKISVDCAGMISTCMRLAVCSEVLQSITVMKYARMMIASRVTFRACVSHSRQSSLAR